MAMGPGRRKRNNALNEGRSTENTVPTPVFNRVAERVKELLEEGNLDSLQRLYNIANDFHLPMLAAAVQKRLDEELVKGVESGKIELDAPLISELSNNPKLEKELHGLLAKKEIAEEKKIDDLMNAYKAEDNQTLKDELRAIDAEYAQAESPHATTTGGNNLPDFAASSDNDSPSFQAANHASEQQQAPQPHPNATTDAHASNPGPTLGDQAPLSSSTPANLSSLAPSSYESPKTSMTSDASMTPSPSFKSRSINEDPQAPSAHASTSPDLKATDPSLDHSSIAPPSGLPTPFAQMASGASAANAAGPDLSSAMSSMAGR